MGARTLANLCCDPMYYQGAGFKVKDLGLHSSANMGWQHQSHHGGQLYLIYAQCQSLDSILYEIYITLQMK